MEVGGQRKNRATSPAPLLFPPQTPCSMGWRAVCTSAGLLAWPAPLVLLLLLRARQLQGGTTAWRAGTGREGGHCSMREEEDTRDPPRLPPFCTPPPPPPHSSHCRNVCGACRVHGPGGEHARRPALAGGAEAGGPGLLREGIQVSGSPVQLQRTRARAAEGEEAAVGCARLGPPPPQRPRAPAPGRPAAMGQTPGREAALALPFQLPRAPAKR